MSADKDPLAPLPSTSAGELAARAIERAARNFVIDAETIDELRDAGGEAALGREAVLALEARVRRLMGDAACTVRAQQRFELQQEQATGARTPREAVYDAQIAPLVSKIIGIAKGHTIPMLASFDLSGPGYEEFSCTTAMLLPNGLPELALANRLLMTGMPAFAVQVAPPSASKGKPS